MTRPAYIDSYQGAMLDGNNVDTLVIHYSATPIENDYSSGDIDMMHRQRGFNEIGYHFFIRKDGTVETGRTVTETGKFEIGAQTSGSNSSSIGICFEGGVTRAAPSIGKDTRTPAQIKAMIKLIRDLLKIFPDAVVEGHRDMPGAATQCPGFDAAAWWASVPAEVTYKPTPARGFWAILLDAVFGRKS